MNNLQLFLLIGQSNMAGRGIVEPQDEVIHPRIFMLTQDLQWAPAKDPLHFDKPELIGVGLGSQFAREIAAAEPESRIGLIPCAVGGTGLPEWAPGGELYTNAVARTREALKSGALRGILWHQGENEVAYGGVETYGENFAALMSRMRADLGAENVPLVIGELGHFLEDVTAFNATLPQVAAGIPLCTYVTAEDLTHNGDEVHFDAASFRLYGQRYATAFLSFS